jgi:hypothetical protein
MPLASHVHQLVQQWPHPAGDEPDECGGSGVERPFYRQRRSCTCPSSLPCSSSAFTTARSCTIHPAFDRHAFQTVWRVAAQLLDQQSIQLPEAQQDAETAYLTMHLLTGSRNNIWPSDLELDAPFQALLDSLMRGIAQAYRVPTMEADSALRDGLAAHLIPACMRQRFNLWSPPISYMRNLAEKYAFESTVAVQLAEEINAETGIILPDDEVNNLVLLLRAAFIRERPNRLNRVIVVCPSGMATAQLLVARLKARFPRLGKLDVLSLRELNPRGDAVGPTGHHHGAAAARIFKPIFSHSSSSAAVGRRHLSHYPMVSLTVKT